MDPTKTITTTTTTNPSCQEDESCLQPQTSFRPASAYTSALETGAKTATSLLNQVQLPKSTAYESYSNGLFAMIVLISISCILYVLGEDAVSVPIDVKFNRWPIVTGLLMFATIWFYFFMDVFPKTPNAGPSTLFTVFKGWAQGNTSSIIEHNLRSLHTTYGYKIKSAAKPPGMYSFLDSMPKVYIFYSFKTVLISTCIFLYIYFWYQGTFYAALGAAVLLLIYLWYLTDFYFMCDQFAKSSTPNEKVENNAFIFSKLNSFFFLFNMPIMMLTVIYFVSNMFPGSRKAGWVDMITAISFVLILFSLAKGETLGQKYSYLLQQNSAYWKNLPILTVYILFLVAFFVMKRPIPDLLSRIINRMTETQKKFADNIYVYGVFPIILFLAYKLFSNAVYTELALEDGVDYNVIRIRYTLIYFLLVVFLCTIFFNQTSVPCYLQRVLDLTNTLTKSIMVMLIGAMISGLVFVISALVSPYKYSFKETSATPTTTATTTTTTAAETTLVDNTADIILPIKGGSFVRIFVCISIVVILIFLRFMTSSIAVFSTAKFFIFIVILCCLFICLCICEFFNTEASRSEDGNFFSIIRNFVMFSSGAAFTCFCISFLYVEFIQKAPDSSLIFYNIFALIIFIVYKILTSVDFIQNNIKFKFVVESIFIIPCLIDSYLLKRLLGDSLHAEYIRIRYNTPYMYFILVFLILLLVLFQRFLYPEITSQNNALGGYILYNGPVNTNTQTPASINNINVLMQEFIAPQVYNDSSSNSGILTTYLYNYSLGFWFFIENTQNSDGLLIDFASNPTVNYNNDSNTVSVTFVVSSTNETKTAVLQNIKIQKWNFLAINVDNGYIDLFLNGTLTTTIQELVPYFNSAAPSIVIGEQNGALAQLCNFNYYPRPLTILDISTIYNTFQNSDPPTNARSVAGADLKNSNYEKYLHESETKLQELKADVTCGYKSMFVQQDVCSNIVDDSPHYNEYISLKWVFEQMGDYTNGL